MTVAFCCVAFSLCCILVLVVQYLQVTKVLCLAVNNKYIDAMTNELHYEIAHYNYKQEFCKNNTKVVHTYLDSGRVTTKHV